MNYKQGDIIIFTVGDRSLGFGREGLICLMLPNGSYRSYGHHKCFSLLNKRYTDIIIRYREMIEDIAKIVI